MKNTLFLIALLLTSTSATFTQEIKFEPLGDTYQKGDNVTITCSQTPENNACKWTRSGREVHFELDKRYHAIDPTNCAFVINPIHADDDARWKCLTNSTSSKPIALTKRLIVDDDDTNFNTESQVTTKETSYIEMEEGQKAHLQCQFILSAPHCFWTKDGDVVAIKGRRQFVGDKHDGDCSIEIDNINYKDDGHWQCCYPRTDERPLIKSPIITLNVTVTPIDPIITVQGVAMEEGATVSVSTNEEYSYYGSNSYPLSDYRIGCWSENGKPAAMLSWLVSNAEGNSLTFTDNSQQTTWTVDGLRSLHVSYRPLNLKRSSSSRNRQHHIKLSCQAQHPNYIGLIKTTYVWIVSPEPLASYSYG